MEIEKTAGTTRKKPMLGFAEILNMSFGFLGIQFGFALQNGNASRILMTFGADVDHLSWFWLVAPVTGMIVQPVVGYFSDRTWNRLGRRRPYFLAGAILTSLALIMMPNAPHLATFLAPVFIGGGLLMIMDASINISMEPFRALVADKLPEEQHTLGFSVQTLLIGIGAVAGSWLPYMMGNWFGVSREATSGGLIPANVTYSFYIGAAVLLGAIVWTVVTTKEYPPDSAGSATQGKRQKYPVIPPVMVRLLVVQFFSWFALFAMWVYTTPAVAAHFYHTSDPESAAFQEAGDWVGILFGIYNGVSAIIALLLPVAAKRLSKKATHAVALVFGGLSLLSIGVFTDPRWLILPMIGIGIAWGSILAMPYALLARSIPADRMGVYMGLFNMSITIPQIVSGIAGGPVLKYVFGNNAMLCLVMAGVSMILGAVSVLWIKEKDPVVTPG